VGVLRVCCLGAAGREGSGERAVPCAAIWDPTGRRRLRALRH